jgi:hypothetical protein
MLADAEALYGPRDHEWTPIGVEFFDGQFPHIWFPGNADRVCIRLTLRARHNEPEALWQLSQEIVHILAPMRSATNLEEGVATHFAIHWPHHPDKAYIARCAGTLRQAESKYCRALLDYETLLALQPNIVRELRTQQPSLSRVKADQLLTFVPSLDPDVARRLCSPHDW